MCDGWLWALQDGDAGPVRWDGVAVCTGGLEETELTVSNAMVTASVYGLRDEERMCMSLWEPTRSLSAWTVMPINYS